MSRAPAFTLASATLGHAHRVHRVSAPAYAPEWSQWLEEIGFVSGEHVSVLARGLPGADPLVVRIGQSTFALRQAEAACIQLQDDDAGAAQPA
ncbi:FeoA family protein [Paucibacter sp. APW11]|uniref:FeoA family protein n=1 Tax=Roseateles aquae TaxID=3077235 RepID=A0ABU3P8S9_9BURK|nr:FeoA family protein [Paucibacter sp. APW11]MDT8998979.1 FeoA family protein [Paucibacter sp. APW11]